ncbi:MAG: hypothetical protein ACYYK0_03625 [Candidatus Eutrophobiaceae bacterium]
MTRCAEASDDILYVDGGDVAGAEQAGRDPRLCTTASEGARAGGNVYRYGRGRLAGDRVPPVVRR